MLKQSILLLITKLGKFFGFLIFRRNVNNDPELQVDRIIVNHSISLIIDVGANEGQFAEKFIKNKNIKKIISFEPITDAFNVLKRRSASYPGWLVQNFALGSEEGIAQINISNNSVSSSLRKLTENHTKAAPNSKNINTEKVAVTTLDTYYENSDTIDLTHRILLKIDTQGFEREVLMGARNLLKSVDVIMLETSFTVLYDGQALFDEIHGFMRNEGYKIINIIPGFKDERTGQLLQADFVYSRK